MSPNNFHQEQDQNTAKLVLNAFYKVADKRGATATEITRYLQHKFGDVWRTTTLTWKAEETLQRSAVLGFLDKQGDRYVANLARELHCARKHKPPSASSCNCSRQKKKKKRCVGKKKRKNSYCCCGGN